MSERSQHGVSQPSFNDNDDNKAPEGPRSPRSYPHASPHRLSAPTPTPARADGAARSNELPPLPPPTSTTGRSFTPPMIRGGGVSSILNPEEPESGRRRKASYLDSPAAPLRSLPPLANYSRSPSSQPAILGDRAPRRILTPRSPSLHRAASVGQLRPSVGTIDASANPFPPSARGRNYTVEPGTSEAPPLPTLSAAGRPLYGFSVPTPPSQSVRRASIGNAPPAGPSASASPTTSYSSYSYTGRASPTGSYEPTPTAAGLASAGHETGLNPSGASPRSSSRDHQRRLGIPISSSGGQKVLQMVSLDTGSGTVQVPVDVDVGSKVADEKRKRNAGASARFRQRRKEKEKESATSIARLEQQLKDLAEDANFYRSERDHMLNILRHVPGVERHFPRPLSPRLRRPSGGTLAGQSSPEGGIYSASHDPMPRSPDQGRNVRRRTSTYSLPPVQQPPAMPPPPIAIQQGYGTHSSRPAPPNLPPAPGSLSSPHGRAPLPPVPPHVPQLQHSHGPPSVLQTLPQPGPFNPFAAERRPAGPPDPKREGQ